MTLEEPSIPSSNVIRIVDANANRATEGLRVVEDHLRFEWQAGHLCGECKAIRHEVSKTVEDWIDSGQRAACRAVDSDVGTGITTDGEYVRRSSNAVAFANIKRAGESLRTLEEYSKLCSQEYPRRFEALRYRLYTLEKCLAHLHRSKKTFQHALLYVLIDGHFGFEDEFRRRLESTLDSNCDVIQLRAKNEVDRHLVSVARVVAERCRDVGKLFIVNDRPDIALLANANGVHVGQDEIRVRDARVVVGPDCSIGVSTHSRSQAERAVAQGADYIGIGPVFPSATKHFESHIWRGIGGRREPIQRLTLLCDRWHRRKSCAGTTGGRSLAGSRESGHLARSRPEIGRGSYESCID